MSTLNEDVEADIAEATRLVTETRNASFCMLQRRMRIGYRYADMLIQMLELRQIVGPAQADGHREVLTPTQPPEPGETTP